MQELGNLFDEPSYAIWGHTKLKTESFAIHRTAKIEYVPLNEIEANYEQLEEMLGLFNFHPRRRARDRRREIAYCSMTALNYEIRRLEDVFMAITRWVKNGRESEDAERTSIRGDTWRTIHTLTLAT